MNKQQVEHIIDVYEKHLVFSRIVPPSQAKSIAREYTLTELGFDDDDDTEIIPAARSNDDD